jgi:hypothetical protein
MGRRCAARRSSARGIFGSAAVLCSRTNPGWATTDTVRLDETAIIRSRSPGVSSTGAARAVLGFFERRVFEVRVFEMRCAAAARNPRPRRRPCRRDGGRISAGLSWSSAEAVSRCGQGDATTRNAACLERGGSNVWRQRWPHASTAHEFPVRWHEVVEPTLYTVEGRQTGDLRQKCGSALIRKAKLPARRVEGCPFLPGWQTRRIERPTPRGRWVCVVSWWSMTTGIPALP